MKYNVNYFIKKFESIPDNKWFVGEYSNKTGTKFCAYGHLGNALNKKATPRSIALSELVKSYANESIDGRYFVPEVNDGTSGWVFTGRTPKERILNLLYNIKECGGV